MSTDNRQPLIAKEGMWLTNGDTYGKTVVLPEGADTSVWYEITEAEAEELKESRSEARCDNDELDNIHYLNR